MESQDIVAFFSHSRIAYLDTSQRCEGVENSDKFRIMSHFFPSLEPRHSLLILVLHFSEVWKSALGPKVLPYMAYTKM